jgi:ABC-type dipeptide/oligopeptide/nickel transport system permease component
MARYIARRLLWLFLVFIVISMITFTLMRSVPGGPFSQEKPLPEQTRKLLEEKYSLNDPLLKQYVDYVSDIFLPRITTEKVKPSKAFDYLIVIKLPFLGEHTTLRWVNFGPSYKNRSRSVNDIFRDNLPISFQLGVTALTVSIVVGVPLGVVAALRRNTYVDYIAMGIAILGVSLPVIVTAPVMRYYLGIPLQLVTWNEAKGIANFILPSFALGIVNAALLARLTRASLLQVMYEDYIRTARAKGLSERRVIVWHALKNSMIPVVTILGPLFAALVTGTFVVEKTFAIPGMGRYFVESITGRDYPVIMGTILLYAVFLIICNLFVDVAYAWLDPRIRFD